SIYQDLSPHVISSSMPAPANAAEALTVGAISWSRYTTGPIEEYSSRGPTNDGRRKPDLVAPDNVSTGVTPYYSPFQGTSAAAPHVAGVAALLLSQDPSLDLNSLRARLLSYCVSMGDPNTYGAGRLELRYAPSVPALVAEAGGPYSGTVGAPITFDGRGSTGDIVEYRWDFGDGATGSGAVVQHAYSAPGTYTVRLTVRDRYGHTDSDTTTATVQPAPTPQGRLTTDKSAYAPGETVRIAFANVGPVTITLPNTAPWTIRDAHGRIVYTPTAAMVLTPVAPGASKSWSWNQRDNSGNQVPPGTYTVELRTSDAGIFTASFTIRAPAKPDLVIESLSYQPPAPGIGDTITFYVKVRNVGGARAGRFYVRVRDGAGYQQASLSGLNPGQSYTVTLRLRLTRSPETFTAFVDYYDRVDELDETNNTESITVTAAVAPLDVEVSLDKAAYTVGEEVTIAVDLNRGAYVYLVELDPLGRAIMVFPNASHPSPTLSGGRSIVRAEASEPVGNESLYAFAADSAIPLFPTPTGPGFPVLSTAGSDFLARVRAWLRDNLPDASWDEDRVDFEVRGPVANERPVAHFTYTPTAPSEGD
ncbi:MAG TPA: PKD domain-containing protein, partial [Candidatus Acetothermia bacterium]|nr:PKD domain-containing protein [Candidatus Acetothermia bacterium]